MTNAIYQNSTLSSRETAYLIKLSWLMESKIRTATENFLFELLGLVFSGLKTTTWNAISLRRKKLTISLNTEGYLSIRGRLVDPPQPGIIWQ